MQPAITLTRCCFDVGPAENQYWVNVSMLGDSYDDESVIAKRHSNAGPALTKKIVWPAMTSQ